MPSDSTRARRSRRWLIEVLLAGVAGYALVVGLDRGHVTKVAGGAVPTPSADGVRRATPTPIASKAPLASTKDVTGLVKAMNALSEAARQPATADGGGIDVGELDEKQRLALEHPREVGIMSTSALVRIQEQIRKAACVIPNQDRAKVRLDFRVEVDGAVLRVHDFVPRVLQGAPLTAEAETCLNRALGASLTAWPMGAIDPPQGFGFRDGYELEFPGHDAGATPP